jgi:DNA repair protein RadC
VTHGHCHPSGEPEPSADDISLSKRVVAAGELLGIDVLDHVIVGHDGASFSLRYSGLL